MPRQTPTLEDIQLPGIGGPRPVAGYDVSAFGQGGQALARAGQTLGGDIQKTAQEIAETTTFQHRQAAENGLMNLSDSLIKNRNQFGFSNDPADIDNWRKANEDAHQRAAKLFPPPNTPIGAHAATKAGLMADEENFHIASHEHQLATSQDEANIQQKINDLRIVGPPNLDGHPDATMQGKIDAVNAHIDNSRYLAPEKKQLLRQHAVSTWIDGQIASSYMAGIEEKDPEKAEIYFRHAADLMGRGVRPRVGAPGPAGIAAPVPGLSQGADIWANDNRTALQQHGIPISVTSAFRTPEHNAAVGGARGSQHLQGKAIDVSLTGLTPQQQQQVVSQFLSDPRTGGFGYYPNSNSIHVDVRQGDKAVWGTDYHSTSVGKGWPSWLTNQAMTWQASSRGATNVTPLSAAGVPAYPRTGYTQPSELGQEASPSDVGITPPAGRGSFRDVTPAEMEWIKTHPGQPLPQTPGQPSQQPASPSATTEQPSSEHPGAQVAQMALSPERMNYWTRTIESARSFKIAEQNRIIRAQEQAQKEASDAYESKFWAALKLSGQPPESIPAIISRGPEGSKELTQQTVEKLVRLSEEAGNRGDKDAAKFGPGYYGLFTDIQSGKINDQGQISQHFLDHPSGDPNEIYPSGVLELQKILKSNHDKGEDGAVNAAIKGQLDHARNMMVVEEDFGFGPKIRNPAGLEKFNSEFIPAFRFGFEDWRKKNPNKDPREFLNRKHTEEMVNEIYPESKKRAELVAHQPSGDYKEEPSAPLPPAPEGIAAPAWKAVMTRTPPLKGGQPMSHQLWGEFLGDLIANPSPQVMASFDKHFGESGFSAAEILNTLTPAAATTGPVWPGEEPAAPAPAAAPSTGILGAAKSIASGFVERERAKRAAAGAEPPPEEPSHFGSFLEGERAKQQAATATAPAPAAVADRQSIEAQIRELDRQAEGERNRPRRERIEKNRDLLKKQLEALGPPLDHGAHSEWRDGR